MAHERPGSLFNGNKKPGHSNSKKLAKVEIPKIFCGEPNGFGWGDGSFLD